MTLSKKTLVIGGGGFIGSYLVPMLIASGRPVTVLGRTPASQHKLSNNVIYIEGDLKNVELVRDLVNDHAEIVHLAYASVPKTSFEDPLDDLIDNLPPSVNLFSEVARAGGRLFLISSGGTVYGEGERLPICEAHPTRPISPYGLTKLALENYAYFYSVAHGLKFICLRPANAYGPGQSPAKGQGFIAVAMDDLLHGRSVSIFGERGTVRDYIHVSDVASGILHAMERGKLSNTYNIGSGVGLSNYDLVIKMLLPLNLQLANIDICHLPERVFDVKTNVLDCSLLKAHTGWNPKVSLQNGLKETLDWLRSSSE